jgi:Domain of unknown function (DUF6316)
MRRMSHTRSGEPPRPHFRSDRVVLVNGAWFIDTREGIDVGPYATREAAEVAAQALGEMLAGVDDVDVAKLFIREFAPKVPPPA